jgi:hypothetical protein
MEAQDYVSKILQIGKGGSRNGYQSLVTKYQKTSFTNPGSSPVRHFIAHWNGLYRPLNTRSVCFGGFV